MTLKNMIRYEAPGKINLGLRVLSKRRDGYHNIETIFYPVKIFDTVAVAVNKITGKRHIIELRSDSSEIPHGKENICYKAAELFFREFKIPGRHIIKIFLRKNIPVGAGLGGGSSDAAAVLAILRRHFRSQIPEGRIRKHIGSQMSEGRIEKLALELGSDVPYFVNEILRSAQNDRMPAYATGRGEKLKLLPEFKIGYPMLIVAPRRHISTKWAYSKVERSKSRKLEGSSRGAGFRPEDSGLKKVRKVKDLNNIESFNLNNLKLFENDFEDIVFKKYPEIRRIKEKMYEEGAVFASMSGTGSAVYGVFKNLTGLTRCSRFFKKMGYLVFRG